MQYHQWNDLLSRYFFNEARRSLRVYLCVTQELLCQLARDPTGAEDFVRAVRHGPDLLQSPNVCRAAALTAQGWDGETDPPFIGYLCFFSLAAGIEGDFPPHAYYPRLRFLLGEPPTAGTYPLFERTTPLWEKLEDWASVRLGGSRGLFTPRWYVKWKHVGLPMGQSLLSEEEIRSLPSIFASSGLDPSSPPSPGEIQRVLLRHDSHFRPRTLRLLRNMDPGEETARDALLDVVGAELADWDGTSGTKPNEPECVNGVLRLCCDLDSSAGIATTYLRCKIPAQFSEDGLDLTAPGQTGGVMTCDEEGIGLGWSTPLVDAAGNVVSAASVDFRLGGELVDQQQGIHVRLPGRPVRVLVSGGSLGLPGFVEVGQLPANAPFLVFAHEESWREVEHWGGLSCQDWKQPVWRGVPSGWRLYSAQRANNDQLIKSSFPILSLPRQIRVRFVGGVRVDRSERYFAFAPPRISVESTKPYSVFCNEAELAPLGDGMFELPVPLSPSVGALRLLIEVLHGDEIERRSLILEEPSIGWENLEPQQWLSSHGVPVTNQDAPAACGATVRNSEAPVFSYVGAVPVLAWSAARFIGARPGQIANWPEDPLPPWQPVWLVQARRRGRVQFCGSSIDRSAPEIEPDGDRRSVKEWKEVVWYRRKDLTPPVNVRLIALWEDYQQLARSL